VSSLLLVVSESVGGGGIDVVSVDVVGGHDSVRVFPASKRWMLPLEL